VSEVQVEGNIVYGDMYGVEGEANVVYSDVCLKYRAREMLCTLMCV